MALVVKCIVDLQGSALYARPRFLLTPEDDKQWCQQTSSALPPASESHAGSKRTQMPAKTTISSKTLNHHRWRN